MAEAWVVDEAVALAAPAGEVWAALTDANQLGAWWGTEVAGRVEVGRELTFSGALHGQVFRDRATVTALVPEQALAFAHWSALSGFPDDAAHRTAVTVTLEPTGGGTRVRVRQDRFPTYEMFGHWRFFWRMALFDLKRLVEGAAR